MADNLVIILAFVAGILLGISGVHIAAGPHFVSDKAAEQGWGADRNGNIYRITAVLKLEDLSNDAD